MLGEGCETYDPAFGRGDIVDAVNTWRQPERCEVLRVNSYAAKIFDLIFNGASSIAVTRHVIATKEEIEKPVKLAMIGFRSLAADGGAPAQVMADMAGGGGGGAAVAADGAAAAGVSGLSFLAVNRVHDGGENPVSRPDKITTS